jgi:hypothetical protein
MYICVGNAIHVEPRLNNVGLWTLHGQFKYKTNSIR